MADDDSKFAFKPQYTLSPRSKYEGGFGSEHFYDINKDGDKIGHVHVNVWPRNPNRMYVSEVVAHGEYIRDSKGKNTIGTRGMRSLAKQLKERHPNITTIAGERVGGAHANKRQDDEYGGPVTEMKFKP